MKARQRTPCGRLGWLLMLACAAAAAAPAPVRVAQGLLQGGLRDGMHYWYDIPFAAPPTGELRWRAPQPVESWHGIRDATEPGFACAQELRPDSGRFPRGTSEDCLYLNVFAPAAAQRGARLPVMVWIHGGSFRWGSAVDPAFDGAALVRDGVVLVTVNYRLDRFGRFAHPALYASQGDEPLANYALMDQVAALRWVRDNVASFGGDPGNVTIFGCSAGGVSVDFLMAVPVARGLFHRAIAQSGTVIPEGERRLGAPVGRNRSLEDDGRDFARHYGIPEDATTAARLRALTSEQVVAYPRKDFSMQPVVDGRLVVEEPARAFAAGRQAAVPFMSGAASWEASLIRPYQLPLPAVLGAMPRDQVDAAYGLTDEEQLKETYFGDSLFLSSAYFLTAQMSRAGRAGYLYEYAHVNEVQRGENAGAYHCSETPRLFGTEWRGEAASAADRRVGEMLRRYWVEFARSGQPAPVGLPAWPAHSIGDPALLRFGATVEVVRDPYPARMRLHMGRYDALRTTEATTPAGPAVPR